MFDSLLTQHCKHQNNTHTTLHFKDHKQSFGPKSESLCRNKTFKMVAGKFNALCCLKSCPVKLIMPVFLVPQYCPPRTHTSCDLLVETEPIAVPAGPALPIEAGTKNQDLHILSDVKRLFFPAIIHM